MEALIGQAGIGGLLTLAVWLILTGRIVPRTTLQDALRERDAWRAAAQDSEKARAEDRAQVRDLLEVAHLTEHVLKSLPRPGEVDHGAAGTHETSPR